MSFASGFAAGSAAVSRGLDLRDLRQQREVEAAERARQEQLRQANASLAREQEVGMQAQADGTGLAMSNVPQQEQYSPQVRDAFGLGGPPPQMSAVQTPAPSQAAISSGLAQAPSTAPEVLGTADMFRRQAALQMQYGDPEEATRLLGLASAEERAMGVEQRALSADQRAQQTYDQQQEAYARDQRTREGLAEINQLAMTGAKSQDIIKAATDYGLGVTDVQGVLSGRYNLSQTEIEAKRQEINNAVSKLRSVDDVINYYNESEELTPGYSLTLDSREGGGYNLVHKNDKGEVVETTPFSSKAEANVHLRRLADDPLTAQAAIVDRDTAMAKAATEAKFKQLDLDLEGAKISADVRTAFGKEAAALRSDPMFAMLPPGEQDARIAALKTDFGIGGGQGGLADRPDETEPEISAVAQLQMDATKQEKAQNKRAQQDQQDARIIASINDPALKQQMIAAASPEARAIYQAMLDKQASQQQSGTRFYGLQQRTSPYTGM